MFRIWVCCRSVVEFRGVGGGGGSLFFGFKGFVEFRLCLGFGVYVLQGCSGTCSGFNDAKNGAH